MDKSKREFFTFSKTKRRSTLFREVKSLPNFVGLDEAKVFEELLVFAASNRELFNKSFIERRGKDLEKVEELLTVFVEFMDRVGSEFDQVNSRLGQIEDNIIPREKNASLFGQERKYAGGNAKEEREA